MAVTIRFQTTGIVPGSGAPVAMRGGNLTIGRAAENDMALPDSDGQLSRRHCVIEEQGGTVTAVDLSTNGTFLNYSRTPIGQSPAVLNNGDVLSIGPYELVVDITAELLDPMDLGPISHGEANQAPDRTDLMDTHAVGETDFLDDLLGSTNTPKGPGRYVPEEFEDGILPPLGDDADPLLPAGQDPGAQTQGASAFDHAPATQGAFVMSSGSANQIPEDWDDLLQPTPPAGGGGGAAPAAGAKIPDEWDDLLAPEEATPQIPEDFGAAPPAGGAIPDEFGDDMFAQPEVAPAPPPAAAPPVPQREDLAFRAFLEGAGASHLDLPVAEMPQTMARVGAAFREMVEGVREVLMTRASIKGEFRINQTTLGAGRNNPLKFSMSGSKAVASMIMPTEKGYLESEDAAHQAMRDIKAHEVAMVTGMEAALKGVLARLDPKRLEAKIEGSGGMSGLLKGKKARYWEVYEKMYSEISSEAEDDFQELFAKEFARAYQAQLDKLK